MLGPLLLALAISDGRMMADALYVLVPSVGRVHPDVREVLSEIRIQGNVATPDDEVRQLAGIEIGAAVTPNMPADVAARLRATKRFEHVDVLKRFASIADPTQIVLVVIVDEGPVKVDWNGQPDTPPRVVRDRSLRLMFLPLLKFEDGYGFSYGVRLARPAPFLGRQSQLSFPLTWGGDKRAAAQVERPFTRGPLSRVETGGSISRRRNPFFEQDDDRLKVWVTAEREIRAVPGLRLSTTTAWQHVAFLDRPAGNAALIQTGADLVYDTRLDPMLARNAVFARAGWNRTAFPRSSQLAVNQTSVDARGYVGFIGQSVLIVRGLREDADRPVPAYLKRLLGGSSTLRGFRTGTAIGDTLVASSIELRVPLTSPLRIGKVGVSAFIDAAKTYDKGERFGDREFEKGIGAGIWFSAAVLRLNIAVAHGIGGSTRLHIGTTVYGSGQRSD